MKSEYVDFICSIHGFLIRLKEIHWNTNSNSEHILCDDLGSELGVYEDEFMECCMGIEGAHFQIGKLLPIIPNSENFESVLKELENDVLSMKKKTTTQKEGGLVNILDDMLKTVNKYRYRATQK